jgi:hypothetical protein
MFSHAANVVAEPIQGNVFKIFFSTRDKHQRSSIGFLIAELNENGGGASPMKILEIGASPIIVPGAVGLFDDSGVSLSCITQVGGRKFLYYLGWNLGVTVPWRNSIGLAIYDESKGQFFKYSPAPLLDRNHVDPYSISYPFVLHDGDRYRMWYGSNLGWGAEQKDMAHLLKYAESDDGIHWRREGHIALNFKDSSEYAMSRPFVLKESGIYKMWYSYRGKAYRIGYAESEDGINWRRMDEQAGITVSASGWDSETVEYPFIFDHAGSRYMFYNGNAYGKTGFGLARLKR